MSDYARPFPHLMEHKSTSQYVAPAPEPAPVYRREVIENGEDPRGGDLFTQNRLLLLVTDQNDVPVSWIVGRAWLDLEDNVKESVWRTMEHVHQALHG